MRRCSLPSASRRPSTSSLPFGPKQTVAPGSTVNVTSAGTTSGLATSSGRAAVQRAERVSRWPSERVGASPCQTSVCCRATSLPSASSARTSSRFSPRRNVTLACHRASGANQSAAWPLASTATVVMAGAWPDKVAVALSEKKKPSRVAKPVEMVSSRGI